MPIPTITDSDIELPQITDADFEEPPKPKTRAEMLSRYGGTPEQIAAKHKTNLVAGQQAGQKVQGVENIGNLVGGATRMAGMLTGPWGAAAVEPFAEGAEKAGRGESPYPTLGTVPRMALNAAIAKIPTGWLGKEATTILGKAGASAAENAITGAGINTVSPLLEGKLPTAQGVLAGAATGGLVGGTVGGVAALRAKRALNRYDPQGAVSDVAQMLRKTGAASPEQIGELAPKLEEAWHEIHHQALKKDKLFNNVGTKEAVDLAKDAKDAVWKENMTRHMDTLGKVPTDVSSVPEAMKKGLDPQIAEHKAIIDEIDNMAKTDFAEHWPLQRIENRIQSLNAETKSVDFAQKVGQAKAGAKLRMLDALRDVEADRIGAITGENVKAFKNRYGALNETEEVLKKAHNINKGTKLSTPQPGKLGRAYKAFKEIDIAHPGGLPEQAVKMVVNKELTPDQLIGRSLKKMGGHSRRQEFSAYKAPPPPAASTEPTQGPDFNQSMQQYLDLNNVSPEAQQFLNFRETPLKRPKYLSEPPKE